MFNYVRRLTQSSLKLSSINATAKRMNSTHVESRPYSFKLGIVPATAISVVFMYAGAVAAKRGAEFLEEWNIFVPEDDDD